MNTNRKISILAWPILFVIVNLFYLTQLSAETDSIDNHFEDFKGLWLTEIKNETVYLLIKKNHIVSYFYKDRTENNIYEGQWRFVKENTLSISGIDFNDLRFYLSKNNSELSSAGNLEKNISILTKIPDEILGDWARPADYDAPKNKYIPSTYFGLWETQNSKDPKSITIWDNRTVTSESNENSTSGSQKLLQGEWYKHGQQLHIAWEDGTYSIIDNRNENRVKLRDFAPGEIIDEKADNYRLIKKNKSGFESSKNQNIQTPEGNISLSQFSLKSLLKFYRGEWITLDETQPNAVEIMKFSRFGGVHLASDSKIKGNWYLSGKGCLINLEDGIRMRLKYVGSAFLIFIYKANRPLDGFPNKVLKAAPLDTKKLDMLNTEVYFTRSLLKQVENLTPTGGMSIPLISNWSDRDTINPTPSSPWWWPIWSDNPKIKEAENIYTNNRSPLLTNDEDSIGSSKESKKIKLPNPIDEIKKTKWEWPF